jgi:acyl-coenzyme A thioesterase PaaI-like protein
MALTLSLTVNYLSQVKGIRLIAEATVNRGRAIDLLRVRHAFDDTGARIATATGVFRYRRPD